MATRPDAILDTLAGVLNAMPGVFSTPQWGGRAYKVAKPDAPRVKGEPKGKILAFLAPDRTGKATLVSFKLPPADAERACEQYDWVEPHSFRTLAPSGWVTATVTTKRQVGTLARFLKQSHAMQGVSGSKPAGASGTSRMADADAGHIDRVMGKVRDDGWEPQSDW